ncbi:MAG: flavin reductase family protein [Gemmatimonadota bacterium]
MSETPGKDAAAGVLPTDELSALDRYQLVTSLVVPRPIGWLSTRSADGRDNLAPFSFFAALSATPVLLGASIGSRRGVPKDSLVNIRETGAFCVNVVTEPQLEAMNATSADVAPEVDEFELAGLPMARASLVDAPYVATCPAVFECRLFREVDLGDAAATLIIGEAVAIRLNAALEFREGTRFVEPRSLRPVGRLLGSAYAGLGELVELPRPPA